MAADYLLRSRHGIFYFRRVVPRSLRAALGRSQLQLSLRTGILRDARVLVRSGAAATDRLFARLSFMNKKDDGFKVHLVFNAGLDEKGEPYFNFEAEPDEIPAAQALLQSTKEAMLELRRAGPSSVPAPNQGAGCLSGPTLGDAIKEYAAQLTAKPTTKRRYAPMLARLAAHFGTDTPLASITQARFATYADEVRHDDSASDKSRNMTITLGGTFFGWCKSRYDNAPDITAGKLKIRRVAPQSSERAAFTFAELQAIVKAASTLRAEEPHKYWVTVLLMFTGMRLEELAQLNIETDFLHDEASGYWYFKIHGNDGNSVKTLAGWREVPVHPAVIEAGLLKYVDELRAKGVCRLFPQWPPREDPEHGGIKYGHEASKWGGRQLAKLKSAGEVSTPKTAYFHSMRHSLINNLKQALVDESVRAALVGHEAGGINNNRYGKGYSVKLLGDVLVADLSGYRTLLGDGS